jgi:hypothetical protein
MRRYRRVSPEEIKMTEHLGLLGFLAEATDIQAEFDVSFDEALRIQRERSAARMEEYEKSLIESNVVQFVPRARK